MNELTRRNFAGTVAGAIAAMTACVRGVRPRKTEFYEGRISDVRLYDHALTTADLREAMHLGDGIYQIPISDEKTTRLGRIWLSGQIN